MKMSEVERLLLFNQYETLKRVDPAMEEHCDLMIKCLLEGYDDDFDQLLPEFEEPIDPIIRQEVQDILQMFRLLYHHFESNPPAVFAGFDNHDELDYKTYAEFLIEDRGYWRESRLSDYSTDRQLLNDYRAMLNEWKQAKSDHSLSDEEARRIVSVAPSESRVHRTK
jgi:hypothetical protein